MKTEGKGKWNYGLEIIMILLGLLFLSPFYFLLANSVKSFGKFSVMRRPGRPNSSGPTTRRPGSWPVSRKPSGTRLSLQ